MKKLAAEFIHPPHERVSNTGRFHTNAAILRDYRGSIQVVDACDLH